VEASDNLTTGLGQGMRASHVRGIARRAHGRGAVAREARSRDFINNRALSSLGVEVAVDPKWSVWLWLSPPLFRVVS
jgi:hypothetical protein